jgi:autophagy-related protein 5
VGQTAPLRLVLHLASPPTDKLLLAPSADACKAASMGQLKEADFIRWGNTKRMAGLRKAEQDGIWEGIRERASSLPTLLPHLLPFHSRSRLLRRDIRVADNFDDYWRVAAKVTPTSTPGRPQSPTAVPSSSASAHTRPPSTDPNSVLPDRDSAFAVRSVPVRIYLPDGPVLQELAPPLRDDGASFPDNPRI